MRRTFTTYIFQILLCMVPIVFLSRSLHAQDASITFPISSFTTNTANAAAYNQVLFSQSGCAFSSSSYSNCAGFTSGNTMRIDNNTDFFDIVTANSTINKVQVRVQANGTTAANAIVGFSADSTTWTDFAELILPANNANPSCLLHEVVAPSGAKYFRMQRVAFGGYTATGTTGQTVRIFEVNVYVNTPACSNPMAFDVTGSALICSGTTPVNLSGSESAVTYQLQKDGISSGPVVAGTGSQLSWDVSSSGVYTVKTLNTGGYCTTEMNGHADVIIGGGIPAIISQNTPGATYPQGAAASPLTVSTPADLNYQWYSNATASNIGGTSVGSDRGGTTNSYTPSTETVGVTYYYCVVSSPCGTDTSSDVSGAIIIESAPTVVGMRFGADFTGNPTSYTYTTTDVAYPTGSSFSTTNSNICSGAQRRAQVSSVILQLVSTSASAIVVHGTSSGSSLRTLTSIDTSGTLAGTYVPVSVTSSSTIASSACGTIDISGLNIPKGTFIKFTFSGNVNLSGFDVTPISGTLPVNITNARASKLSEGIRVEWSAWNEVDIKNYEVEKSNDGRIFTRVASLNAFNSAGSSYQWLDATATMGVNYYRIKAVSADGVAKYSQVLTVNMNNSNIGFNIYPNPVKGNVLGLQLNNIVKGQYEIILFNQQGQKVQTRSFGFPGGISTQTVQLNSNLAAGIYHMVLINSAGYRQSQHLILQ